MILFISSYIAVFVIASASGGIRGNSDSADEDELLSVHDLRWRDTDKWILILNDATQKNDTTQPQNGINNATDETPVVKEEVDPWSVVWYLGAFGGLIAFFLVVTCSEWCFGNHIYTRHGPNQLYINAYAATGYRAPETPPPPYHLFAPPTYAETLRQKKQSEKLQKKQALTRDRNTVSIFVIPVHRRGTTVDT